MYLRLGSLTVSTAATPSGLPVASRGAENTCGQRLCLEQGAPPGLQADTSERERDTGNGEGNAAFERLRASIEDEKDEGGDDEKPHG